MLVAGAGLVRQDPEPLFGRGVPQPIVEAYETDARLVFRENQGRPELQTPFAARRPESASSVFASGERRGSTRHV